MHADPLQGDVAASDTATATSYGDLTTVGPSATKTLVNGQKVLVVVSARIDSPAALEEGFVSFQVTGASTLAASDTNAASLVGNTGGAIGIVAERTTVFTATATGSHTFTCKYRVTGGTWTFRRRRIVIKPF